uniref:Uncharacterized protein n=1 Tax=Octopus bimaculoides TaxID=37653 RepID=A0A0L8H251_OCTBM
MPATPYFGTYFLNTYTHSHTHTHTHTHMCTYTCIQTVSKAHIQLLYDHNTQFIHKYCNPILTNLSLDGYTDTSHNHTHIYLVLFLT